MLAPIELRGKVLPIGPYIAIESGSLYKNVSGWINFQPFFIVRQLAPILAHSRKLVKRNIFYLSVDIRANLAILARAAKTEMIRYIMS